MKNEVFIIRSEGRILAFLDSTKEVAEHLGVTISAVSRAVNEGRTMRGNIRVEKKPRIILCKIGKGIYDVRTAENRMKGSECIGILDITECYYRDESNE